MAARLPTTLDVPAPQGARASGLTVRPTDFGLGDAAEALAGYAVESGKADDRVAGKLLREAQTTYAPQMAERAAAYDGRESGWASREGAEFDKAFKPLTERTDLPEGVRLSLARQVDQYRAQAGGQAIGVEAERRGSVIGEQQRVVTAQNVASGFTAFQKTFGEGYQKLTDAFDGSQPHHVADAEALFSQASEAALAATPEADRAALQIRLQAQRPTVIAQALETQDKAHTAYVAAKVKDTSDTALNSVIGNPSGYAMALAGADDLAAGLPARLRQPWIEDYKGRLAGARIEGLILRGDLTRAKADLEAGTFDAALKPERKAELMAAVQAKSAEQARDMIEALRYGGDVDPDALSAAAKASGDVGLQAHANYALEVGEAEPGALNELAGGGTKAGFNEAAGFVIDSLEGGDALILNDNGRGASRFGINQAANPDLNVATLTRGQAMVRYQRYWRDIGGSRLPAGLGLAAFDAAVLFGADDAKAWLARSGGDVGQLLNLERAEMQRLAKADPARYGDDLKGWLNRVDKVSAEAARRQAFENVQEGLASDPVKFALGSATRAPLANVPALPAETSGPAFQAALKGRLAVGQMMSARYRAPLRLLTNAEVAQVKDQIERDPMAAVSFAGEALQALGPTGARAMLAEIGEQAHAGVELHLADLAAAGLQSFAQRAARGLALKAKGATLETSDLGQIKSHVEAHKELFAGQPELRLIVQQSAEAAMLADQQTGATHSPWAYINAALGATRSGKRVFGGVAQVNGAETVLPPWLSTDHAGDALEQLANGWSSLAKARPGLPPAAGLKTRGNLDPWDRPILHNPDGSYSTTSSASFNFGQGEVLLPTVVNGKRLTNAQAIARYKATGENFGTFDTPAHANAFATALHTAQDGYVRAHGGPDHFRPSPDGPVYLDGSPIPADRIKRMRLQLQPNGNYRLLNDRGVAMLGRSGRAFEFDLDAARPGLRTLLGPDAVLGPAR